MTARLLPTYRRGHPSPTIAALAMLAIWLRLLWPIPLPIAPVGDLAALLGEHALCLADAASRDAAPTPRDSAPPPAHPGGHDGPGCCPWHAGGALILTAAAAVGRVSYPALPVEFYAASLFAPGRVLGPAQARAPPIGA